MWTSRNFETYKKRFDFSSSEQGNPTYTALKIDNDDFLNMVEALEGEIQDNQVFQTIVCDQCGMCGCASGNWVAIRHFGNFIFIIPVFEEHTDEANSEEFTPPYCLTQKGAYWLTVEQFGDFKKLIPELDKQKSIKELTKIELVSLYKWDTPHKMFGKYPGFQTLKKNHVLVVSDLDNETAFEIFDRKLKELESATDWEIKPLTEEDKIISVFLDDRLTTEWKALCKTEDDYELLLGGTFKILSKF